MMIQGIVIPVCPSIIFVFGIAKAQTSALSTKHITAKGNAHSIVQKVGQKRKNFQKEKLFTFLIFILLLKKKKENCLQSHLMLYCLFQRQTIFVSFTSEGNSLVKQAPL